ncbi:MAG TPA: EAL domain-containing protein [Rugosimonospora sp.]|nr:EAL domain-containing protein [Rugosimonospora sp.]
MTPPPARRARRPGAFFVYAGVTLTGTAAYPLLPPQARTVWYDAVSLSVVLALLVGARRSAAPARLPWYLFAAGQFCYSVGDVTWNAIDAHLGYVPSPSLVDAAYLGYYPPVAAGLVLLARRRSRRGQWAALLDALTAGTALGLLAWVLIRPSVVAAGVSLASGAVNLAYPAGDLALLVLTLRLAIGPGRRSRAFQLLVTSMLLTSVADLVYLALSIRGNYNGGAPTDCAWLLGYATFGCAALHPSMRQLGEQAAAPDQPALSPRRMALLAGSGLFAPAVLVFGPALGEPTDVASFTVGATLLYLLLLSRLVGVVRRQERAIRRERVLHEAGRRLVSAASLDEVREAAVQAAAELAGPGFRAELTGAPLGDTDAGFAVPLMIQDEYRGTILVDGPYPPGLGAQAGLAALATDVALAQEAVLQHLRRQRSEDELRVLALHDTLTGLANRALFVDRLQHALDRRRAGGPDLAVLFIDLDDFKTVNDSLGHQAGDELLVAVAHRLRGTLRVADTAARFGGDEFAVLLDGTTGPQASQLAQAILRGFDAPFTTGGREVFVRVSVGVATADWRVSGPETLLRNADVAMYRAKSAGGNGFEVFQPSMHAEAVHRLELRADLERALERGELVLFYQPIVDLASGRAASFEALIRWRHPTRGLLEPGHFIPIAEETGLIIPIGQWVLRTACQQAYGWQRAFGMPLSMAVNVSVRQLADDGLIDDVAAALRDSGLSPQSLTLELTESAFMADTDAAVARVRAIKDLGVRLAIDDFGTGYSSLSYLDRIPADIIKIDRSFVSVLLESGDRPPLVQMILDLARNLHVQTVAEGVENQSQYQRLQELGCFLGQGYLFSRPLDPLAMEQLLASGVLDRRSALAA